MRRSLASRVSGARPPPFPEKDKGKIISRRPPPFPEKEDSTKKTAQRHQLGGMPDLAHVQAFIARGDQAVTFSPGTWHAPMLVNGEKEIKFIVFMVGNGIPEAGNKVVINASGDELEGAIHVAVPGETASVTKSDTSKNLVQEKGERLWTKAKL
ncbi:MAG: Ureidoglycolate lyase [Trizodia sp. TS-e1964]|nr:MAG: Ureidoglycolate lyase [Trizodia sp. TS-e1964]